MSNNDDNSYPSFLFILVDLYDYGLNLAHLENELKRKEPKKENSFMSNWMSPLNCTNLNNLEIELLYLDVIDVVTLPFPIVLVFKI